jgi:predicted PurR-regulated permease PerM
MLFGFLIIGVKYSVLFAFIVALLDALPLIGVGTVLVPWSIYNIIFGEVRLGVGLAVLFIIHAVLREFIEPKIVGKNLGIHPIVSLLLLYAGYFIFGFLGLLLIPLISVIINILINKDDTPEVR